MTWFRRVFTDDDPPRSDSGGAAAAQDDDTPDALRRRLWSLVQLVNANAGRLPVAAVVAARDITDTVARVIDTSTEHELDIHAVVQINGIVGDYLPTTLRAYLSLDPVAAERPDAAGRTPHAALLDQLADLATAADELLAAARSRDADALFAQGNFLRTKFGRTDLDL